MLRYYQPQYSAVRYIGKDAEVDVVIPAPDITVRFTYHFIRCKDRIVVSKSGGPYTHIVGQRMTTNMEEVIESFLKLDELKTGGIR